MKSVAAEMARIWPKQGLSGEALLERIRSLRADLDAAGVHTLSAKGLSDLEEEVMHQFRLTPAQVAEDEGEEQNYRRSCEQRGIKP